MSAFRQDSLTGAWVIVAPERGQRPRLPRKREVQDARRPGYARDCPFCPGNEHMLPGIIEETPLAEPPGWRARVLPNKYPALRPETEAASAEGFPYLAVPGHGYHEVIVDTPRHDAEPASLGSDELADILRVYRRRYAERIAQPGIQAVVIFRNRGEHGGASLPHPHSQLIATGLVPPRLAAASAWAREHHERASRCVTCEVLSSELEDGQRVVDVSDHFAALVPFAAACPFDQRIVPTRHQASFDEAADDELADLGEMLKRTLARLATVLDSPPYHYVVESGTVADVGAPHAHWHLRIVPITSRPGGFELGTGMPINTSLPETDAEMLRSAAASLTDDRPESS